jgi:hypothetical protein
MEPTDAADLKDLSDDDIVSTQLESQTSLVASTGIAFQGLEHSGPIPIRAMKPRRLAPTARDVVAAGDAAR